MRITYKYFVKLLMSLMELEFTGELKIKFKSENSSELIVGEIMKLKTMTLYYI